MIVEETSKLELSASHSRSVSHQRSETLTIWSANGRRQDLAVELGAGDSERVTISDSARVALLKMAAESAKPAQPEIPATNTDTEAAKSTDSDPVLTLDSHLSIIRQMLEKLTGHAFKVFSADDLPQQVDAGTTAPLADSERAQTADSAQPPAANWGVRYAQREVYEEQESASFSASGSVRTSDGRSISFSLQLSMSSSFRVERSSVEEYGNVPKDPLVINFAGTAAQLSDRKFRFDLDGDGRQENLPTLASGSGYLVFDRNGDGLVNSGKELFGPASNNGFAELAALDRDNNGWIDEADPDFNRLAVWRSSGDGMTLSSLREAGIGALAVAHAATPLTLRGTVGNVLGSVRDSGIALTESGQALALQQIDVVAA